MSAHSINYNKAVSLLADMVELDDATWDASDASLRDRAFAHLEFFVTSRVQPALKKLGVDYASDEMMQCAYNETKQRRNERKRVAQHRRAQRIEAQQIRDMLANGAI